MKFKKETWKKVCERMDVLALETEHLINYEHEFKEKFYEILAAHCEVEL